MRESQNELEDLQAAEGEERTVRAELSNIATALGEPVPLSNEPIDGTRRRLAEAAAARIDDLEAREIAHETAREVTLRLRRCFLQVDELRDAVTRAAQDKRTWDSRLKPS